MSKELFLDFETSDTKQGKKRNPSPYLPTNFLVSYGYKTKGFKQDGSGYHFIRHNNFNKSSADSVGHLQKLLDEADVLIAFNAKFELSWLYEAGFKFNGSIRDTMITEYVLSRGVKVPLDLDSCCIRRGTAQKKKHLVDELWEQGLSFNEMPMEVVEEYGNGDIDSLFDLDSAHNSLLRLDENKGLIPTIQMSWDFIKCLVEMERNGIYINTDSLEEVRKEFTTEHTSLRKSLNDIATSVMGDTPINLDSPEQLSNLIYSRKVINKKKWAQLFNIGTDDKGKRLKPPRMKDWEFIKDVREHTEIIKRTSAVHCSTCAGTGFLSDKLTKSGRSFKRAPKCGDCNANGYTLRDTGKVAGLRVSPQGAWETASGGFGTDKETLAGIANRVKSGSAAHEFCTKFIRYNAVGTYLDTFVNGIARALEANGLLHTQLMQAITRTGRLSSREPNFQNMPRAKTFPVRRVVVSRFKEGSILEVDFAQLEFRVAAYLAQDKQAIKDILDKVDVHSYTSKVLTEAGQITDRQDAKPHTFKPLYGGSTGTDAEQKYYQAFKDKYPDIMDWQNANIEQTLQTGTISIPSGREYTFPGTRRTYYGYVLNTTQICNYPVQGFATADIVPVAIILVHRAMQNAGVLSKLMLTVHDSVVIDIAPGELAIIIKLIDECFKELVNELSRRYDIILNVPMGWEIKAGADWLNMKEIFKGGYV